MCGAAARVFAVPGADDAGAGVRQAAVAVGEEMSVEGLPELEQALSSRAPDATPLRLIKRRRRRIIGLIGPSRKHRVRQENSHVTIARVRTTVASAARCNRRAAIRSPICDSSASTCLISGHGHGRR